METAKVLKFPKNIAYICEFYYLCTLFVEMVNMANQKEDILKLAAREMQKVGIRSVSVDDICRELGMSKKTFYVYFASKDALVECILRMGEAEGKKKLENILAKKSIVQCIVEWTHIAKQSDKCRQQTPPLLYDLQKYYPNIHKEHQKRLQATMQGIVAQFLEKGKGEGIFRKEIDNAITASLFVNMHMGIMEYTQRNQLSMTEALTYSHQAMDILLRGVFTSEGLKVLENEVNNK